MSSLTYYLKQIKNQPEYFSGLDIEMNFPNYDYILTNPYPNWVNEYKLWGIFGTFSDYVIRKIIMNLFSNKNVYQHNKIVAECTLKDLPIEYTRKIGYTFKDLKIMVEKYKDNNINWIDCLWEMWILSYLDLIYRNGIYKKPDLNKSFIDECSMFFMNIEEYFNHNISHVKNFYLNSTLGNPKTVLADCDLIFDNVLIDIKTVKRPEEHVISNYYQLLGYVSLYEWLKCNKHKLSKAYSKQYNIFNIKSIDVVGYFFPQHLKFSVMSIKDWKIKTRLDFLDKLIELKGEKKKVKIDLDYELMSLFRYDDPSDFMF